MRLRFAVLAIFLLTKVSIAQVNFMSCIYNDNILVITNKGLKEYHPEDNSFSELPYSNLLPKKNLHTVFTDKNNTLWIGTYKGMFAYKDGKIEDYNDKTGLPSNIFSYPFEDSQGRLWFTSFGQTKRYVAFFENGIWKSEYIGGILPSLYRFGDRIFEDDSGNIIVGTDKGLIIYDGSDFITYQNDTLNPCKRISNLLKDKKGNIWFACERFGLTRFSANNHWRSFESKTEFPKVNVSLVEDSNGRIWYSGKNAVGYIENEQMHEFSNDETKLKDYNDLEVDLLNRIWLTSEKSGFSVFDGESWIHLSQLKNADEGENQFESIDIHVPDNSKDYDLLHLFKDSKGNLYLIKTHELYKFHGWIKINTEGISSVMFLPMGDKAVKSLKVEDFLEVDMGSMLLGDHVFVFVTEVDDEMLMSMYISGLAKRNYFIQAQ